MNKQPAKKYWAKELIERFDELKFEFHAIFEDSFYVYDLIAEINGYGKRTFIGVLRLNKDLKLWVPAEDEIRELLTNEEYETLKLLLS